MKDNLIRNSYVNSFDVDDSDLKSLIIINTKCLVGN